MSTPLPAFFDPSRFDALALPRYTLLEEAASAASANVRPAHTDTERIAVFGIDCQVGFCVPGASLYVPGALDDMRRAGAFILRNAPRITELIFSLDTHTAYQIFHPGAWRDAAGAPPAPMTPITAADVKGGVYTPIESIGRDHAIRYCEALEARGKYVLTIWPYHTLLGSCDHALVPGLFEVAHYHSLLRQAPVHFETKGRAPLTENYSVLEPEVKNLDGRELGAFNQGLMDRLLTFDKIYVLGEASSHCVAATLFSILDYLNANAPDCVGAFTIVEDCMSPVPAVCGADGAPLPGLDFPAAAKAAVARCAEAGMGVVGSEVVV